MAIRTRPTSSGHGGRRAGSFAGKGILPTYPHPRDVRLGVVYGPGDIYTGTMTGGGNMILMRRR